MNFHKLKETSIYNNMFGFESNIDITNDTQVLFRKNVVIKNIIFISNLIYTFIFSIASIGEPSNWLLTIICFPITFLVNHTLNKMINRDKENLLKQQIAMYMCCFYMFLSAILIYTKLKTGVSANYLGEVGYILFYYSLVICSFYQDKKMLKQVYGWSLVIITVIHFSLTYNIVFGDNALEGTNFFKTFFTSYEFKDILLRTIILIIFMLVLYISVSMSNYMQEERKKELKKRREVEDDYTKVVTKIFETTLTQKTRSDEEINQSKLLCEMSKKLSSLLGRDAKFCDEVEKYANIHIVSHFDFYLSDIKDEEEKFLKLKEETKLGSIVISRLQLERKTEDIIRAHMDGSNDDAFTERMCKIQNDEKSQIIMISDLYITLRSIRSYKRALNHNTAINYLKDTYRIYFDPQIFDRFIRFQDDFEKLYDNFKENLDGTQDLLS